MLLFISEDPFEFDSSLDESFVMPLRRKRKGGPYKSKPPQTATPLTTPHSTPVTDAPSPMATPLQIATPPTTATPVSFSSPSAFVQPQAMESLCSSHPNARYVRLNHVTTITTVRQYVSTEIVDRSTGSVVHSGFTEVHVHNVFREFCKISCTCAHAYLHVYFSYRCLVMHLQVTKYHLRLSPYILSLYLLHNHPILVHHQLVAMPLVVAILDQYHSILVILQSLLSLQHLNLLLQ